MKLLMKSVTVLILGVLVLASASVFAQSPPDEKIIDMVNYEDYRGASAAINKKLAVNPADAAALYEKGYLLMAEEKFENARDAFKEGIKSAKKYPYNHIGLARAYHKLGLIEDRDNSIAQSIKVNKGDDVSVMIALANAYTSTEQLSQSKLTLYKARETDPKEPRVYEELGDMYYAQKVYDVAQENYEKALSLDPTLIEPYFRLGRIYIIKKEFAEGAKCLNKAIELDPNLAAAYRERGELWLKAGSNSTDPTKKQDYFKRARDDYKKYLELEKNDKRAQLRYASFMYLSGNYEECLKKLEEVDTVTVVSQRLRGYCAMEMGNLDKAKKEMEKYFEMAPPEKVLAEDYQTLANIYVKEGDDEKAVEYFDQMAAKAKEKDKKELSDLSATYEGLVNRFKQEKDASRELFYWEQLIDAREGGASTKDYYGMGMTARKNASEIEKEGDLSKAAAVYVKAKLAFAQVVDLTPDYAPAQFWLGYVKEQIKNTDSTSDEAAKPWAGEVEYEKVWELLGNEPLESMSNGDKYYLANTALYLSLAKFIPNRDDNYDCEAAKPFIAKAQELDPDIANKEHGEAIKTILETCEAGGK
jgi:pentatricopeptide repeat protein